MPYRSVDDLQKVLSEKVFSYAKDRKKAAGRALGTLVEVITFYLLKTWDFCDSIAIERALPEYSNEAITHNVEYSLHPSQRIAELSLPVDQGPISVVKIAKALGLAGVTVRAEHKKASQLLSSNRVLRNACVISDDGHSFLVATLLGITGGTAKVAVNKLLARPFAVTECKRVGIEEGTRKGPQTIEKAKQGAYVARTVSSLQKIRFPTGEMNGILVTADGKIVCKKYEDFVREIVNSSNAEFLRRFILTIGVVSNHGNWFTSDEHNKELKVLAQSYDWLLFLTDDGLAEFISDLILGPKTQYRFVREAFLASYTGKSGSNQFTKVQMAYSADQTLMDYFKGNLGKIESWFNIIAPGSKSLRLLRDELRCLARKDWENIHR